MLCTGQRLGDIRDPSGVVSAGHSDYRCKSVAGGGAVWIDSRCAKHEFRPPVLVCAGPEGRATRLVQASRARGAPSVATSRHRHQRARRALRRDPARGARLRPRSELMRAGLKRIPKSNMEDDHTAEFACRVTRTFPSRARSELWSLRWCGSPLHHFVIFVGRKLLQLWPNVSHRRSAPPQRVTGPRCWQKLAQTCSARPDFAGMRPTLAGAGLHSLEVRPSLIEGAQH